MMDSRTPSPSREPSQEIELAAARRKSFLRALLAVLVIALIIISGAAGYYLGYANRPAFPAPVWEAWNVINQEYVDQPVDDTKLMEGAIDGMVRALGDSHSAYMPPDQYEQSVAAIQQSYSGIGAEVDVSGPYLKIIAPFPDSPAIKAGLQPGDEVLRINGEDMTGIDPKLAIQKVHGPTGSSVRLSIRRESATDLLEFDLIRAKIEIPSVRSGILPGDIAYVRLYIFGGNSGKEVHDALVPLLAKNPKGLILDLRANPGGLVTSAVEIASEFLPPKQVITIAKMGDGTEKRYETSGTGLATQIPMVILVDKGSASASEMLAGALQDYGRATLVGSTTYGKGSMQDWIALSGGTIGAMRLTVARFYTPKGRTIDRYGLTPDIPVAIGASDIQAGNDTQLAEALRILALK
jgi:carboxyl-terminal processing protease